MPDSNITLRSVKGSALSHGEMDDNFQEFFYSASISGSELYLYRSQSSSPYQHIQTPYPKGPQYALQLKTGTAISGATIDFTGSKDLTFDYDSQVFTVTGSSYMLGDLTVEGTVVAEAFQAETIITSISSGSTSFGNDAGDVHIRTGSVFLDGSEFIKGTLRVIGLITGSANFDTLYNKPTLVSGSSQIRVQDTLGFPDLQQNISASISSSDSTLSASAHTQRLAIEAGLTADISSLSGSAATARLQSYNILSSSVHNNYLKNTTDTLTGDLNITGTLTANTYVVSSSVTYLTQSFSSGSTRFGDSSDDTHIFTGSVDINGNLAIPGFSDVSASLAAISSSSGNSNVTINNNADNRVLTATGTDALNGEANLTFDGTSLEVTGDLTVTSDATINGTVYSKFTGTDTDITGLIGGSDSGTLIKGLSSGHFVLGLQEDSLGDSFGIIGGGGDFYSNTNYDKLLFKVSGSGYTYVGGDLEVSGSVSSSGTQTVNGTLTVNGAVTATGDITAFYSSDERLKDNVTPISNAIDKVNQIGGYEFDWNSDSEHSGHDVGVIAQEIEKVLPEIVVNRDNGYKAVRYEKIVALLISAIKEQQLQIEELKSKL